MFGISNMWVSTLFVFNRGFWDAAPPSTTRSIARTGMRVDNISWCPIASYVKFYLFEDAHRGVRKMQGDRIRLHQRLRALGPHGSGFPRGVEGHPVDADRANAPDGMTGRPRTIPRVLCTERATWQGPR